MFGFLRKREKGSAYRLDSDHEARLRKMEAEIARLKKAICLAGPFYSAKKDSTPKEQGEKEDGENISE